MPKGIHYLFNLFMIGKKAEKCMSCWQHRDVVFFSPHEAISLVISMQQICNCIANQVVKQSCDICVHVQRDVCQSGMFANYMYQ